MNANIARLQQASRDFDLIRRQCDILKKGLMAELDDLHARMDEELAELNAYEQDAYHASINDLWIETAQGLPKEMNRMRKYCLVMNFYSRY
ncbi:MAG: hypothetical protein Q8R61_13100 [Thiobacillus sp.]|uniref:hypothetical protein n=1 Tax=Thiobacillus sp. TaxID=924 RepID=UPI0027338D90|nr:hypothetical protein [Thiobacillus sp.]MDP3586061.1 hypothetical protein [Thiobacillus sp.]